MNANVGEDTNYRVRLLVRHPSKSLLSSKGDKPVVRLSLFFLGYDNQWRLSTTVISARNI